MKGEAIKGEEGFTIIEVLVAAVILVLGSLAVFMTFAAAIHNVQRGREQQIGVSVAQREMERVRVIPYEAIALSSSPTVSTDAKSPDSRLRIAGEEIEFNLSRGGLPKYRPLEVDAGEGEVTPETGEVRAADGTEVTVFRFVACEVPNPSGEGCASKRIVIDVLPTAKPGLGNYRHSYYELQSSVVDPTPESIAP